MRRTTLAPGLLLAAAALTACNPNPAAPAPTTPAAVPPSAAPATEQAPAAANRTAELPDFTGQGLQVAQDKAQSAGFYSLHSHDALGRSRAQLDDLNWKVCSQTPAAGQRSINVAIDMAAVKLDEQCPATDQGASTPSAGSSMPDVKGRSAAAVRDLLPRNTSLTIKDAAQSRAVLVESNWQVCSQSPAPGTELTGQPITLKVVKFGETCP
ncbi:PASTA domain-containing protein [Streptomyces sp. TLI_171]|uniref:PASTA domain-containing protein n=1 Tax=Streptomyces sp. TLI_171 TaxID=1938859 RepID=UPI000C1742F5|nr:PASTA domain-containing protein [Streptomyces sp. TLI_171]